MSSISIGKGIASTSASAWIRQASTLFLYMIAARVLTPDQIGLFALANAVVLLFEYAVYDSLSEAIVQRSDLSPCHVGAGLMVAVLLAAAIVVLGLVAAGPFSRAFGDPLLSDLLQIMSAGVAFLCLSSIHFGLLRRHGRFERIALTAGIAAIAGTGTAVVLLLSGVGLSAMIAYFLIEKAILCLGTFWAERDYPVRLFSGRQIRDLMPYATAIGGQRMIFYARSQMDRVVIGALWGPAVLGGYHVAARIFDSLQAILLQPASKFFFVSYSKLQGNEGEALDTRFLHSLQAVALVAFPAFLGVSAVAPEVITLLFGEQWRSSAVILEILSFGGLALVMSIMSGALLSAAGQARHFLMVELIATVMGVVLLVLVSPYGIAWMAFAFVLRETLAIPVYAWYLQSSVTIAPRQYLSCFLPCLTAAFIMWLTVWMIDLTPHLASPALTLATKAAIGAVTYILVMLALGRSLVTQTFQLLSASQNFQGDNA